MTPLAGKGDGGVLRALFRRQISLGSPQVNSALRLDDPRTAGIGPVQPWTHLASNDRFAIPDLPFLVVVLGG